MGLAEGRDVKSFKAKASTALSPSILQGVHHWVLWHLTWWTCCMSHTVIKIIDDEASHYIFNHWIEWFFFSSKNPEMKHSTEMWRPVRCILYSFQIHLKSKPNFPEIGDGCCGKCTKGKKNFFTVRYPNWKLEKTVIEISLYARSTTPSAAITG